MNDQIKSSVPVTTSSSPAAPPVPPGPASPLGLGDAIGAIATPIARALGMPCVDPLTKQLRPESPCAKRKAAMNAVIPDLKHPLAKVDNPK